MNALILILGLMSGQADYRDHTWYVCDHVVGHALSEDSSIITTDGVRLVWEAS